MPIPVLGSSSAPDGRRSSRLATRSESARTTWPILRSESSSCRPTLALAPGRRGWYRRPVVDGRFLFAADGLRWRLLGFAGWRKRDPCALTNLRGVMFTPRGLPSAACTLNLGRRRSWRAKQIRAPSSASRISRACLEKGLRSGASSRRGTTPGGARGCAQGRRRIASRIDHPSSAGMCTSDPWQIGTAPKQLYEVAGFAV
jgi:hypothetical protein